MNTIVEYFIFPGTAFSLSPFTVTFARNRRKFNWMKPRFWIAVTLTIGISQSALAHRRAASAAGFIEEKIQEATVLPPKDQEACFSPEQYCDIKFWKFIQSAKKSLDVAIYDITHVKIVHELLVASKRIPVRVVVDLRQAKGAHSLVPLLIRGGIQVRIGNQRGIMHNKFTVLDGQWVETGSFNYTNNASDKNNENQLYLNNPRVVEQYQRRFAELWEKAKPVPVEISRK